MTIGVAARQTGVGVETIRFYERTGLIVQPPRRDRGYRQYSQETISRIHFIKSLKSLGFKLSEIGSLLKIMVNDKINCAVAENFAVAKIIEIDEKIQSLRIVKSALLEFKEQCKTQNPDGICIINDLYQTGQSSNVLA